MTDRETLDPLLALRDSEARARSVLESAVDAIVTIDSEGIIDSFNPAAVGLFGYEVEEVLGENVSMLMPAPFREEHDSYLRNHLHTGYRAVIGKGREVVGRRKDGTTFPLHLSVGAWTLGERKMFTGICHDLSDQKRAQAQLENLVRIVENSCNEVYVFGAADLTFRYVNKAARRNVGYSMGELTRMTPVDLKPEFDQREFAERLLPLQEGAGRQIRFTTEHQRKDGSRYPVEVWLQLHSYDGSPAYVAFIMDITERLEREQQVAQTRQLASLGHLAAKIAHEVNNPIAIISGKARLALTSSEELSPKLRADLEKIVAQCDRVAKLNRSLMTCSRPSIEPSAPVDLNRPIERVLSLVADKAGRYGVRITPSLAPDLALVQGQEAELEQVFLNLALNAIDAMSAAGGELHVETADTEGRVVARVRDSGPGIDAEILPRIFEPFFTTKGDGGNGLGLAICYGIVTNSGGSIDARPADPHGVEFTVSLPAHPR